MHTRSTPLGTGTTRVGTRAHSDPSTSALFAAIVETSDDAIVLLELDARIATWGSPAERLFGHEAAAVVALNFWDLFPEHLRDGVRVITSMALSGELIKHFESEIVRADGLPVPVWLSFCPILEADDRPSGVLVVVRDITEQRVAQATLAEVESRLRDGEALARVGSWMWDLRTDAVQWSTEFHRIHGVNPFTFEGTLESHLRAVHPGDRKRTREAMHESVTSGRPFESEYRIVRPDGEVRLVHVRAQPSFGSTGSGVGLRGIGQDVTDPSSATVSRARQDS